jgi:hypothetical protein
MTKLSFTIDGSVALKKALVEEIGLDLATQVCTAIAENNKDAMGKYNLKCCYTQLDSNTTDMLRKIAALCVKAGEDYGMTARKKL